MNSILVIVGTAGFFIILFLMHFTNLGIRGIRSFDEEFQLFDMQLRYEPSRIFTSLEKLGIEGRNAYQSYLIMDYLFILCFLVVMAAITSRLFEKNSFRIVALALAFLRALFDVIENTSLIYLINNYPRESKVIATVCSYATTLKFISLFAWLILIGVSLWKPHLFVLNK